MEPYLFMDEGGVVLGDGLPPLVQNVPVAIVSVAEKVSILPLPGIPFCVERCCRHEGLQAGCMLIGTRMSRTVTNLSSALLLCVVHCRPKLQASYAWPMHGPICHS